MVMRTMRANIGVLKWMFVLLLIVFGAGMVMPNGNSRELATAAALVNGKPVAGERYSRQLQARLESERQTQGELTEGESLRIRREVMDSLIDEQLALEHAETLGQKISAEEFRQAVLNDPGFRNEKGGFDAARYNQLLQMQAEQGMDWKAAEANFQRGMLLQKVRGFFATQALLTPAEQAAAVARLNRQVKAQVAVWDLARLKAGLKLTDEELKEYYSKNKPRWAKAEQMKLRQILVKVDLGGSTASAKAKAEGILAKVKAGGDFKALAKSENTDPDFKENAGDIGWVSRSDLRDPVLSAEAFKLKPGQVSGVIQGNDGFHIVKAEDRKAGFEPTFENSKGKAKEELSQQRASKLAGQLAAQALAEVKKGAKLETAARAHQGTVLNTGSFGRDDKKVVPALGEAPALAQALLSLNKGEVMEQVVSNDKGVAFGQITEERPGAAPSKAEAAEARAREALNEARGRKADQLFHGWLAGLRKDAKIKDQIGVLPVAAPAAAKKS
jgi:peptidyl-prolyl cis-trans isomerase D